MLAAGPSPVRELGNYVRPRNARQLARFSRALLIVVAIVYERRRRGSVHPVFAYGGPAVVLYTLGIVPFAGTAAWQAMIQALERLTS